MPRQSLTGDSGGFSAGQSQWDVPVSFPNWKAVLAAAAGDEAKKEHVRQEVFGFLRFCKASRAGASITVAKAFIAERERQAENRDEALRRALRWFFKAGKASGSDASSERPEARSQRSGDEGGAEERTEGGSQRSGTEGRREGSAEADSKASRLPLRGALPPPAARDLGRTGWEQALVKAARVAGFLWRTEQAYRGWAARFAAFIAPSSPDRATETEVAAFLTELAVTQRASPSTQKQAFRVKGVAHAA